MLTCLRRHNIKPLCAVCAGFCRATRGAPYAAGAQKDLEEAQRELDEFFGTEHAPAVDGAGGPSHNPFSTAASPMSATAPTNDQAAAYPSTTGSSSHDGFSRLSHVDDQGRASMVDVAQVCFAFL